MISEKQMSFKWTIGNCMIRLKYPRGV